MTGQRLGRADNRGITFVELIIAIAISAIVFGAATFFLRTALKNYNMASNAISLQSESQILMEQIGMWVMEGNRVVANPTDGTALDIYYEIPDTVDAVHPAKKRILFYSGNKLYMIRKESEDFDTSYDASTDIKQDNIVGEHVAGFRFQVDDEKKNWVKITLDLKNGSQTYSMTNEFKVRNRIK